MTIGFSSKNNVWTSKYSYQPMFIGNNDRTMVTFSNDLTTISIESQPKQTLCWVHSKTTQLKNTFYNKFTSSSFSVSFNQPASLEKTFNAVSIESNQDVFSCSLATNIDNPLDANVTKPQTSYIQKFTPREESLYSYCGKSQINSKQNVSVFGHYVGRQIQFSDTEDIESAIIIRIQFIPISPVIPSSGKLFFQSGENYFVFSNSTAIAQDNTLEYQASQPGFQIVPFTNEIQIIIEPQNASNIQSLFALLNAFMNDNVTTIGCISDPQIDGDELRGRYMLASFFSDSSNPFEVSAVNAEFSHSRLDSE
jgi:hypothetical protein